MTIALVILKLIMFTLLIVGPIVIGRQITQAARGRDARVAIAAPVEVEEAA